MSAKPSQPGSDVVEIRVPADASYVSTIRLAAASLAARCDLTIDEIEDLRLAVDEACSLLLPLAGDGGALEVHFGLEPGCLQVATSVAATGAPDSSGFAWTVLEALTSTAAIETGDGRVTIRLSKRREAATT
jgi:serine/threonine-protein kinase RsbW